MDDVKTVSIVDIKPAGQSKIIANTALSSFAVPIAAWIAYKLGMPDEAQLALAVVLGWAFNMATVIIKIYFTSTITAQSAKNTDFVMKDVPLVVVSKPESAE